MFMKVWFKSLNVWPPVSVLITVLYLGTPETMSAVCLTFIHDTVDLDSNLLSKQLYLFLLHKKIVLNDCNITSILPDLHCSKLEHQGGLPRLERTARSKYHADFLREHCRHIWISCEECVEKRMRFTSSTGTTQPPDLKRESGTPT